MKNNVKVRVVFDPKEYWSHRYRVEVSFRPFWLSRWSIGGRYYSTEEDAIECAEALYPSLENMCLKSIEEEKQKKEYLKKNKKRIIWRKP